MQCSIFRSSMSNKKCIHVCLFKSHSCLYTSEWNLSFLQYHISMTPSSIPQPCLQWCCYSLVFICTFDYDITFPTITVTCHLSLLRFILLVSLSILKRSFCVQHLNAYYPSACCTPQFSFTMLHLPKHGQKYYLDPKSYTPVSPYFMEPFIWWWTISKFSLDIFVYTFYSNLTN